jgi:adenylate cyclase
VHFIKTIGDAVMFVSTDAAAMLTAALELLAVAEKEDLPQLRIGLAAGSAVRRAGDWFGSPVNLASRVTAVARPGSVLAAESVREAIGDPEDITWSFAGARHLKGSRVRSSCFGPERRGRNSTLCTWLRTSTSKRWAFSTASTATRGKSAST